MTPKERYRKLEEYLSAENPVLLEVIREYQRLDRVARGLGLLEEEGSYTAKISWWPLISVLGTFSAGKSTFINHYLGMEVQQSGNQAVDDKFTVICYGGGKEVRTLPGLALDADPRFPFYNISEEVEKVERGEGSRVNLYLQLKTIPSDAIKGKILIDSPGFDADSQRSSILRISSHIIEMSDLVLIFFDARHPEPGAMRDTLEHLVARTVEHRDRDKILYILNQIDTTAREDNLEDVIGAWQRALSQKGLISGNFYAIYNEEAMQPIDDPAIAERLKRKRDEDWRRIMEKMEGVKIERAYRITKALEDFAKEIKSSKLPGLRDALRRWGRRVLLTDLLFLLVAGGGAAALFLLGILPTTPALLGAVGVGIFLLLLLVHFSARSGAARREIARLEESDPFLARAMASQTRWYRPIFGIWSGGWIRRAEEKLDSIIDYSRAAIRKLNDQFVHPLGQEKNEG
ncbi:dynamin family protein [Nitratifractor sp.]